MTGEYLRAKIIMSGFQQSEVAERLDISPQNLESKLQAKDIKVSFLLDVAKAINKTVYYFFSDIEDENSTENNATYSSARENEMQKKADDFILMKIAEVLSSQLSPQFDVSQKSLDILTEAQSRILLNQGELLDKVEEMMKIINQNAKKNTIE
ncbi:helix-turn-helix domain-containing protein [Aquimarina macrocephali]|uniref:helix-turn-helix domain-containing protein n=1 Tax=Aquimarina macrocephali TaxID=666563 RepID=UPI000467DBD4|nr:transcriptional regulator [Aquimarina macrocephali]